jgi:hypothetical protein
MVNRRRVLKFGAATIAGNVLRLPAMGVRGSHGTPVATLSRAVCDERFPEGAAFAHELRRAGDWVLTEKHRLPRSIQPLTTMEPREISARDAVDDTRRLAKHLG